MTLVTAVVCSLIALPQGTQGGAGDEQAIRDVVGRYVDARQVSDPAAIRELFTPDADQLTSSGEWRRGADALVRGMLASSRENAGTRTIAIGRVRFVAAGAALADGEYTITPPEGGPVRRMWTSFLLAEDDAGQWRIAAIRNMLPASPASIGR